MSDDETTVLVTEAHVSLIRRLTVVWDSSESGAPVVFGRAVWTDEEDEAPANIVGAQEQQLREALLALPAFVKFAKLSAGRYAYESAVPSWFLEQSPFVENRRLPIEGQRVTVDVRPEHLKLLQSGNIRVGDEGGLDLSVGFDSKRPYGDMTYYYLDMADILGIVPLGPPREDYPSQNEFTEAQCAELDAIHETMEPALQVFLQNAVFEPGRFAQRPAEYGEWRREP